LKIARWLRSITGHDYQRVLSEVREGNVGDVYAEDGCFVVQCKAGKQPPIWAAHREAQEASEKLCSVPGVVMPITCIHRDAPKGFGTKSEKLVVMSPETFAELVQLAFTPGAVFVSEGW
jgi:hypothetical protein